MNGYSLADDPEWRDFHGYSSVEEGRAAIRAMEFREAAEKDVVRVNVSAILSEWYESKKGKK